MAESRVEELRRRLERDPASRLFAQLAEEHRRVGSHAEAVRVARAGLALHPGYPSARLTLGRALQDAGDLAAARTELEEAVRQAPDNIMARRCLGQVLESVGEIAGALEQNAAALRMAPGDVGLRQRLRELVERLSTGTVAGSGEEAQPRAAETPVAGTSGTGGLPEEEMAPEAPGSVVVAAPPTLRTPEPTQDARDLARDDALATAGGGAEPTPAEGVGEAGGTPFSSSTLAELYHRQGLHARAVEVYRKVLAEDPGNTRARTGLSEIMAGHAGDVAQAEANGRAARQHAIERTIGALELLLGTLRRR